MAHASCSRPSRSCWRPQDVALERSRAPTLITRTAQPAHTIDRLTQLPETMNSADKPPDKPSLTDGCASRWKLSRPELSTHR